MADERIVAQDTFEQAIKDILTELVNSTYQWEEYTPEQISDILEISDQEAMELTKIINDNVKSNTKIWSSNKTDSEIKGALIEANKYTDDLVANLSNIKLDIVDTLPDSTTVDKSTIYILKDSSGGTNNTLNVWSDSSASFVEVGSLSVSMDDYYDKTAVDNLLADKANADEVVTPDDIITDITQATGTNVLAASTTVTELDKKFDKSGILSAVSATPNDNNVLSEKATKTELDKKVDKTSILTSYSDATTDEHVFSGLLIKGIFDRMSMWNKCRYFSGDLDTIEVNSVYNVDISSSQNMPVNHWGFVITMIHAYAATYGTQIFISMQNTSGHGVYMRIKDAGIWCAWQRVLSEEADIDATAGEIENSNAGGITYWGKTGKIVNVTIEADILLYTWNADGLTKMNNNPLPIPKKEITFKIHREEDNKDYECILKTDGHMYPSVENIPGTTQPLSGSFTYISAS